MTQIACELNRMGSVTARGNPWRSSSVRYILLNEVYVGDVIFRKTPSRNIITGEVDADWQPQYVRDHHRGIVDRRTWDAVQAMLNKGDPANQRRDKCS